MSRVGGEYHLRGTGKKKKKKGNIASCSGRSIDSRSPPKRRTKTIKVVDRRGGLIMKMPRNKRGGGAVRAGR